MEKGRPSLIMITPASDDILWCDTKKNTAPRLVTKVKMRVRSPRYNIF